MRCVSYTRAVPWSSHAEHMDIQTQNALVSGYITGKPEWKLEEKYSDRKNDAMAVSGFDKMLEDGMAREYDCIILPSIYHCGTSFPMVKQFLFNTLYAAGIQFAVVAEDFSSSEKTGEEVAAYFEEKRRQMHSDYVHEWMEKVDKQYVFPYAVPYGYTRTDDKRGIIKDENVSEYVEQIFLRRKQGQTRKEIADWLNSLGVETPGHYRRISSEEADDGAEQGWTAEAVRRIVHKRTYTGATVSKKRKTIVEGTHEAYITLEDWQSLPENVDRGDRPKFNIRQNYKQTNPLSFHIFCKDCGEPLQKRTDKKTGEIYFQCCGGCRPGRGGWMKRVPLDEVMEETIHQLNDERDLALRVEMLLRTKNFDCEKETQKGNLTVQMKGLLAQTEMEQLQRIPLYEQFCAGEISEEEYNGKLDERLSFYQQIDNQLSVIAEDAERINTAFTIRNPWVARYSRAEIPKELTKPDVRRLIERVEVHLPKTEGGSYSVEVFPLDSEWKRYIEEVLKEAET